MREVWESVQERERARGRERGRERQIEIWIRKDELNCEGSR